MMLYLCVLGENFSTDLLDIKPILVSCPSQHDKGHYSDPHAASLYIHTYSLQLRLNIILLFTPEFFKRYLLLNFIDNAVSVPHLFHA
jgi:hypothetical protein